MTISPFLPTSPTAELWQFLRVSHNESADTDVVVTLSSEKLSPTVAVHPKIELPEILPTLQRYVERQRFLLWLSPGAVGSNWLSEILWCRNKDSF